MNFFKVFQDGLEDIYFKLNLFSDLDWDEITSEYIASHESRPEDLDQFIFNFPAFLQQKAAQGDSPPYLHELAYVLLMQVYALNFQLKLPQDKGLYLNPSLSFLHLEFDVLQMLGQTKERGPQIIERPHILCIYQDDQKSLGHLDISTDQLSFLEKLEEDALIDLKELSHKEFKILDDLKKQYIVFEIND